jgi:Tfp pilus assembly protein PilN
VIVPNLASRPFLNTRPVWIVTAFAVVATVVMVAVNINIYVTSRHQHAALYERCSELEAEYRELEEKTRGQLDLLAKVHWRSLGQRVERFNVILREYSFSWLKLLSDIERVMPYKVRLTDIQPSISPEKVTLTIEAVARDREAMLEFLDNLIVDPSFSRPIPDMERHPEGSTTAIDYLFTLKVIYDPQAEAP